MKRKLAVFVALIVVSIGACAQDETGKFGVVTRSELMMKTYPLDTSAAALVIYDIGAVVVETGSSRGTVYARHFKVKILRRTAIEKWGNLSITGEGRLSKLKGATYNLENGEIQKTDIAETGVYKSKSGKHGNKTTIPFPNVKVGSIIECSYSLAWSELSLPRWDFQNDVPALWSEYALTLNDSYYRLNLRGDLSLYKNEVKYNNSYHRWIMRDVPAFVSEPSMPDESVFRSSIEFISAENSWGNIYKSLIETKIFNQSGVRVGLLENIVDKVVPKSSAPREKIRFISNYIKENVVWDGYTSIYSFDPKSILEKKTGDSGDINQLLITLLIKAGLDVTPVILSTRNHGYLVQAFPTLHQFNYVVGLVKFDDGTELFVDATEKYLPYDVLPARCFNHQGFLIGKEVYGWVAIEPVQAEKISFTATVKLNAEGGLKGDVTATKEGYSAFNHRTNYSKIGESEYKKELALNNPWIANVVDISNVTRVSEPLKEVYEMNIDQQATVAGDIIYLNPYFFFNQESNPFTAPERYYPIDFENLVDQATVCTITIPDGYRVEELPSNKAFALPENAAKCTFSMAQNGNQIIVVAKFKINKTLFQPGEYPALREFYARMIAKKAETIVLKKK
jgi:Domain of Unknown Function with PDB structure (DUF3857)/Domain of Unknown Function with PDB structure (DUF3858)